MTQNPNSHPASATEGQQVITDVTSGIGTIWLRRKARLNALSRELMRQLDQELLRLEDDPSVRVIVLRGHGGVFSTGMDLNEAIEVTSPLEYLRYNRIWTRLMHDIEHCLKPVLAVIEGYCLTGGLELALSCDYRIASDDATFAVTSARIGSVAGAGATQRLPRLIGTSKAKRMLFTAEHVDARDALDLGLVDEVHPATDLDRVTEELAGRIAACAPISVALHKLAVTVGMNLDLSSALDFEAALSSQAFATDDKREGMDAFLNRRRAVWKGS